MVLYAERDHRWMHKPNRRSRREMARFFSTDPAGHNEKPQEINGCSIMTQLCALSEPHYTIKEVAAMLRLSPTAIRRRFHNEPGVLRFGQEKKGHRRAYVTLRIPASVVERVYRRCLIPSLTSRSDVAKKTM
jgi:AraC-like DNA-binding protein